MRRHDPLNMTDWQNEWRTRRQWAGRASVALGLVALAALSAMSDGRAKATAATAPAPGSWSDAASPPKVVFRGAGRLADGKVMVAELYRGEVSCEGVRPSEPECYGFRLYDPARDEWGERIPSPLANFARVITGLPDGTALVGFISSGNASFGHPHHFDPRTGEWTEIRSDYFRANYYTHTLIKGTSEQCGANCGKVLVAGGGNDSPANRHPGTDGALPYTAELFDPEDKTLTLTTPIPPDAEGGHSFGTATLLADGRVWITAGFPKASYFFDPGSEEWAAAAASPAQTTSTFPNPVRLLDGTVLVGSVEAVNLMLFDPEGGEADAVTGRRPGSWTALEPCPLPEEVLVNGDRCHPMTLLPDGTVLATVGQYGSGQRDPLSPEAFVFDPAAQAWTETESPAFDVKALVPLSGTPAQCGSRCDKVLAVGGTTARLYSIGEALGVTGVSPSAGFACGGAKVTISGRGLGGATTVAFGDTQVEVRPGDVNPEGTAVTVQAPPHQPGQVEVRVSVGAKVVRAPGAGFTYKAAPSPSVAGLSQQRGPVRGGTAVDVAGQFAPECVRQVIFGDTPAAGYSVGSAPPGEPAGTIAATSPPHEPGPVRVRVEVEHGPEAPSGPLPTLPTVPPLPTDPPASDDDVFAYFPTISGVFPPTGLTRGGEHVTLVGDGLANVTEVRFGAAAAGIVAGRASGHELVVVAPPRDAPDTVLVQVVAGGQFSPDDVRYTYTDPAPVDPAVDPGDTDAGPARQDTAPAEPAPPGGSPAPSPGGAPSPGPAPSPSAAQAPTVAPSPAPGPGLAPGSAAGLAPGQAPVVGQAPSQAASAAAVPPLAPVAGAAPAPAQAAPGSGQAAGSSEDEEQTRGSTRHAMVDAQVGLGMAGAAASACFSWMALTGRVPSRRRRPDAALRPSRTY